MNFDVEKHTIYLTRHGSYAYGTNVATSDIDIRGIAVPPKDFLLGFAFNFDQAEGPEGQDRVVFGLRKFFKLAVTCNPNVLELLYTDTSDHMLVTPIGAKLLEHRDMFLSRMARDTFAGYATSQLKRIKTHRGWLLNKPSHKPTREEFGLPSVGNKVISNEMLGAINAAVDNHGYTPSSDMMEMLDREKRYAAALRHWDSFVNWEKTRNKDRASLEAKYGFDAKHGMHLIKLLRQCVEILKGQGVKVRRPDAEELLSIRNGAWSYDRLIDESDKLNAEIAACFAVSPLPSSPDIGALNRLCVDLTEAFYEGFYAG